MLIHKRSSKRPEPTHEEVLAMIEMHIKNKRICSYNEARAQALLAKELEEIELQLVYGEHVN